jgi:hypothetical protein
MEFVSQIPLDAAFQHGNHVRSKRIIFDLPLVVHFEVEMARRMICGAAALRGLGKLAT